MEFIYVFSTSRKLTQIPWKRWILNVEKRSELEFFISGFLLTTLHLHRNNGSTVGGDFVCVTESF
jgi:hypothetical protein